MSNGPFSKASVAAPPSPAKPFSPVPTALAIIHADMPYPRSRPLDFLSPQRHGGHGGCDQPAFRKCVEGGDTRHDIERVRDLPARRSAPMKRRGKLPPIAEMFDSRLVARSCSYGMLCAA